MASFVGLVDLSGADVSGEEQLRIAKSARAWTDLHGGRGLSAYWTEGNPDLILVFESLDADEASQLAKDLENEHNLSIKMTRALTQGEKERANDGRPV